MTYTFKEEEHPVTPNKKKRTQPSTLQSIVAKLKEGKHTRDVYSETRSEAGDLRLIGSVSSFPKSLKQIQKLKERSQRKSDHLVATQTTKKDELFAIMLQCVEDKTGTKGSRFLQFVQGAAQPLAFLADERQLKEVERFCTNPSEPAILSVDPTYNCGAFYVTPTTYRHKQVISKRTGKHPVMIGPTLIHKHRDEEAFAYLASSMIRVSPRLVSLLAIGSDRDKAIKKGLGSQFPNVVFVACKKHFEDDLKRKLSELGVNDKAKKEFMHGGHFWLRGDASKGSVR